MAASSSSPSMMNNMEKKKVVSLKSFEGDIFQVDERVALQSETIKTMMNESNGDTEFPVPNVKSRTLERMIQYCEKHVVDDASTTSDDEAAAAAAELRAWDLEFVVSFDTTVLYHVLLASNYLEVKGLLELCAQRTADLMKGKSPEEIRKIFGIKNDFPPGEEEAIRNENPWAFEIPDAIEIIHQQPVPPSPSEEEHNNNTTAKVLEEKLEKLEIDDDDQQDKTNQ